MSTKDQAHVEPWRDPAQIYDSKSRDYADTFGISKHERLYFPMSPARNDQGSILRRMVASIRTKGVGSFATYTLSDTSYRVDVAEDGLLLVSVKHPDPAGSGLIVTDTWWWSDTPEYF